MLLQHAAQAAQVAVHPLSGTAARYLWLLPLLPLLGFVLNGLLSLVPAYHPGPDDAYGRHDDAHDAGAGHADTAGGAHGDEHPSAGRHRFAGLVSLIGPGVLLAAFALALAIFFAMLGAGGSALHAPFVQQYFSWMPVGDLQIIAAFQLDQL